MYELDGARPARGVREGVDALLVEKVPVQEGEECVCETESRAREERLEGGVRGAYEISSEKGPVTRGRMESVKQYLCKRGREEGVRIKIKSGILWRCVRERERERRAARRETHIASVFCPKSKMSAYREAIAFGLT